MTCSFPVIILLGFKGLVLPTEEQISPEMKSAIAEFQDYCIPYCIATMTFNNETREVNINCSLKEKIDEKD